MAARYFLIGESRSNRCFGVLKNYVHLRLETMKNLAKYIALVDGFFSWPIGFLGHNSWSSWLLGDTAADRAYQKQMNQGVYNRIAIRPNRLPENKPLAYDELNVFWRLWAQLTVIKPVQFKTLVVYVLAFCGNPLWEKVLYGTQGARRYRAEVERSRYQALIKGRQYAASKHYRQD